MWVQVLIQSLQDRLFFQDAMEPTIQAINWLPHSCPAMISAAWLTSFQYDLTFIPYFTPFLYIFVESPLELLSLDIDLINWMKVEIRLLRGSFNLSTPGDKELKHISVAPCLSCRAEPILQRIKEDRTRVVSPSFDNIKYDTFEIEEYPLSAQGFDWELWCRYLNPPKVWWAQRNHTAPIR